jgi:hypothetical protein
MVAIERVDRNYDRRVIARSRNMDQYGASLSCLYVLVLNMERVGYYWRWCRLAEESVVRCSCSSYNNEKNVREKVKFSDADGVWWRRE